MGSLFGSQETYKDSIEIPKGLLEDPNKLFKDSDLIIGSMAEAISGASVPSETFNSSSANSINPFSKAASSPTMSYGTSGMGEGYVGGYGVSNVNPLSVAGTEGSLIAGSLGSKEGGATTSGILGSESTPLKNGNMGELLLGGVSSFANGLQSQKSNSPPPPTIQNAPALGFGSDPSSRRSTSTGVLKDVMNNYQGILSQY